MKLRLLLLIVFIIALTGCGSNDNNNKNQSQAGAQNNPAAQQEQFLTQYSSPNQTMFHNTLKGFSQEYKAASNEIKKSAVCRKKRDYLLATVPSGRISNWIGTIKRIGTTKGGDYAFVDIESDIADCKISYITWNNSFSDIGDRTMIPLNSPVYNQLGNLNEGNKVVFTAQFIKDKQDGFKEGSFTEGGNVTDTEFIVRFIDIRKFEDALANPYKQTDTNNFPVNNNGQAANNAVYNSTYSNSSNTGNQMYPPISLNAIAGSSQSSADVEGSYVHSAALTVDNNTASCWSEGVPGLGIGENITINFNGIYKVSGMDIWIGHQKSNELFYQNARPTRIRLAGSDGSSEVYYLSDQFGMQRINFTKPINTKYVNITIEQAARGNKYEDTCISEVKFF